MKKLIILVVITALNSQEYVTQDMIYDGVIDTVKKIPENVGNLGKRIYAREVEGKKGFFWYFHKNQKMQR
ncbi:MAG: hypothetical protein DSZ10_01390, partial [Sulfurovum sp.]